MQGRSEAKAALLETNAPLLQGSVDQSVDQKQGSVDQSVDQSVCWSFVSCREISVKIRASRWGLSEP